MPYISSDEVKVKRNLIRKEFPDYKISVTRKDGTVIRVAIAEGPIQLMNDPSRGSESVNHYYINEHYRSNPEAASVLSKIKNIINSGNGTQFIDGDYGAIPEFYVQMTIGNWDKPYVVRQKK